MKTRDEGLEQVLDRCLDMVLRDGAPLESCLQHYPQYAAELEPLLRTALDTQQTLYFIPSASAKDRARLALQNAMRQHSARPRWLRPWGLLGSLSPQFSGPYRWAMGAAAALLLVVLAGTSAVAASSNSVPGETLYPVKLAVEQARLNATFGHQAKAQLHASLASRRAQEMSVVAAKGDTKRAERLATEVEQQLRKVQENALPGLLLTVINVTPGPEANGPPEELIQEMKRLKLTSADKRNMQALQQRLENELKRQDNVFQQQMKEAHEPAKKGLENAQQATRQKYDAMLKAAKWLAEEDATPEDSQQHDK